MKDGFKHFVESFLYSRCSETNRKITLNRMFLLYLISTKLYITSCPVCLLYAPQTIKIIKELFYTEVNSMKIIELFYNLCASNKVEAWSKELGTRLSGISCIGNFRIKVNYSLLCLIGKSKTNILVTESYVR